MTNDQHSAHFGELSSQFVGGAEQRVLDCAFRRIKHAGDRAQPHAVVVLEFEHHPFAGREATQGANDALLQLASGKASLRAGVRAVVGHAVKQIVLLAIGRSRRIQVPAARMLLAQVIQAEIGDDVI